MKVCENCALWNGARREEGQVVMLVDVNLALSKNRARTLKYIHQ
jgi:hypothetical protein